MIGDILSKSEIEERLRGKGDYVQIDYLDRLLKEKFPRDTKKFIYAKLAEIYEKRGMLNEAAKMYEGTAIISVTFSDKIKALVKATELYIRTGYFEKADNSMKNALAEANASERTEIMLAVKNFYKRQAEIYEKELRRNNAARIYEKLLEMSINSQERKEIKDKLLRLYEQLGKIKEFYALKRFDEKKI